MANLSEDIQCAGSDTRLPMLDRTDFASWQQCIQLYCRGKENGVNILKSIDERPFQMGTFRETLAEGNEGLPKDIYTLINHYTDAKDIWDNVKMLLEGSELTKEDSESQLYDDFEHFRQNKGETIYDYYVKFTKLINDMRNIKMTMPRILKESNYDQLYAYLKQHENKGQGNNTRGAGAAGNGGVQNRFGNANPGQARQIKCITAMENGVAMDEEQLLFLTGGHDTAVDEDVDESPV
ncbi:hypothetical protein Tco_1436653 [Tanacetum coccineum]